MLLQIIKLEGSCHVFLPLSVDMLTNENAIKPNFDPAVCRLWKLIYFKY